MRFIKNLITIVGKNLLLVFRSWSSLFLLVLGPLILILLVGYAFSGEGLHDIKIGYYAQNPDKAQEIIAVLQDNDVMLLQYYQIQDCISSLKDNYLYICIEFSDDFKIKKIKDKETSQGNIIFYYDNARFNLVAYLTKMLNERLAVKTEEITLEATKTILQDISATVEYMQSVKTKIIEFRIQAVAVKEQLIKTKNDLEQINADFQRYYMDYQQYSPDVKENAYLLDSLLDNTTIDSKQAAVSVNQTVGLLNQTNKFFLAYVLLNGNNGNVKVGNATIDISPMLKNSLALENQLSLLQKQIEQNNEYLEKTKHVSDSVVSSIDNLSITLEKLDVFMQTSLQQTQENIDKIDSLLLEVYSLLLELDNNIDIFTELTKTNAGSILKPITSSFVGLLKDIDKVTLIFPVLLVFVITFIAILLSTMNVLQEISSPAHFRTFLLPVKSFVFVLSLFITNVIVVALQLTVLLIIANVNFNIDIFLHLSSLLFVIFLLATIFITIGMIYGYLVKNKQISVILSTFTALIFFLFSDVIFPTETMPKLAAFFVNMNPLVIGERLFRKLLYYDIPLGHQAGDVFLLIFYIAVFGLLLLLAYRRHKRKA